MRSRVNRLTALLIDVLLRNARGKAIAEAAHAFARCGVPIDVALRVLTNPSRRRRYPTPPLIVSRNKTLHARCSVTQYDQFGRN